MVKIPPTQRPPVTEEELRLLATPDKDLEKRAFVCSFDEEQYEGRINQGERWQQLIQAHLYYDHVITQILEDALVRPEAIKLGRLGFAKKLDLIKAMGLLKSDLISAIKKVNGLRNKIAHNLEFEVTDKDVLDLANITPQPIREAVIKCRLNGEGPITFGELLSGILHMAEVTRQVLVLQRLRERKAMMRLRTKLERIPGAFTSSDFESACRTSG